MHSIPICYKIIYHNHKDNFLSKVISLENAANYQNNTCDKLPKILPGGTRLLWGTGDKLRLLSKFRI
jgi:hypothetical protein